MCILRVLPQRLPAVYSCIVCCIYLQILKHAMLWHLSSFILSPYVYSLFPLSELSTISMTFTLCNSSPQRKIIPIIVSVRYSRSDPTQVRQARGKLLLGEWRSQSTEAIGLLQKLVRKRNYDYKGQERREEESKEMWPGGSGSAVKWRSDARGTDHVYVYLSGHHHYTAFGV